MRSCQTFYAEFFPEISVLISQRPKHFVGNCKNPRKLRFICCFSTALERDNNLAKKTPQSEAPLNRIFFPVFSKIVPTIIFKLHVYITYVLVLTYIVLFFLYKLVLE